MDTEDGVEVVWNEVRYSSRKAVAASKVCAVYSGTSDKGPSEIGTTSLQGTLVAAPC